MNKFLLSFQKSPIIAHCHLEQKNADCPPVAHWWPTSGKFYRHEDWLESHRWPNIGKLLIIQPKTTGGPTLAHRWQNVSTIRRWPTGGMLSGKALTEKHILYLRFIVHFSQISFCISSLDLFWPSLNCFLFPADVHFKKTLGILVRVILKTCPNQ